LSSRTVRAFEQAHEKKCQKNRFFSPKDTTRRRFAQMNSVRSSSLRPQSNERVLRAMAVMAQYDVICARQEAETAALQLAHERAREAYFLQAGKNEGLAYRRYA